VVVLEKPEKIPFADLDSFVSVASGLRTDEGVPLSLVFLSTSNDFVSRKLSRIGCLSIVARNLYAPDPSAVVDGLLDSLYSNVDDDVTNLPVLMSGQILKELRYSFEKNHFSASTYASHLKIALAHHFTTKGSFLALVHNPSFVRRNSQRLTWFCLDSDARSYVLSELDRKHGGADCNIKQIRDSRALFTALRVIIEERCFLSLVGNLVALAIPSYPVGRRRRHTCSSRNVVEPCLTLSDKYRKNIRALFGMFRHASLRKLVELFLLWRDRTEIELKACKNLETVGSTIQNYIIEGKGARTGDSVNDPTRKMRNLLNILNKSLIMLHILDKGLSSTLTSSLAIAIEKRLRESLVSVFDPFFGKLSMVEQNNGVSLSEVSILRYQRNYNCPASSLKVSLFSEEPRRMVAASITSFGYLEGTGTSVANGKELISDVGIVYRALNTRIVAAVDWFEMFVDAVSFDVICLPEEGNDNDILQRRFEFAVYQLIFCGLVSRSRRKDCFEKSTMTWCSV